MFILIRISDFLFLYWLFCFKYMRKNIMETLALVYTNNKGADQPMHRHSLNCELAIRSLESTIDKLAVCKYQL